MATRVWLFATVMALTAGPAAAQDARNALQAAATAMGVTNMNSIQFSGTGWQGAVGQNFAPDVDWPRTDLASYTQTIDFATMSSKVEMVRQQGNNPGRGGGGVPVQGQQRIINFVSGSYAWNMNGNTVTPALAAAEQRQIDIYLTPWGFIKGAMANNPTAITRNEYGERVTVVSFVALGKYRINGTINSQNVIQRVQSWLPSPVVGDMYIETVYSNYKNIGGLMFPGRWHQHQDFDDGASAPNVSGGDHAFGLETISDVRVNVNGAALTVPEEVRKATIPPVRVETQRLANGVWLIAGGSHNSVAVEFRDSVAVIEAPLNEDRSLAVIAEVTKLVPNKPIRYVVNTHHHWDHLGGIRTYVHEGATVVTHEGNRPYYQEVLRARPWLLKPDRFSLYPPEEWSEGYIFETVREKFILGDETRTIELHNVPGLGHALGMLIAYLPKEKLVVEADLYNPPAQGAPVPAPTASNRTFRQTLERLKLDVGTIVPLHGRPVPMADFLRFVNTAKPATN
jgi:glyoxylase-like metal-dependent hydrolase (beta-lactamase superfamily II)